MDFAMSPLGSSFLATAHDVSSSHAVGTEDSRCLLTGMQTAWQGRWEAPSGCVDVVAPSKWGRSKILDY